MNVGDEVVRVSGGPGYVGSRGTVVEVTESRVRVYWHTPIHPALKPKRTWVARSVVRLVGGAA
jgi:hypothetical protein